jgi:hypothetical protein
MADGHEGAVENDETQKPAAEGGAAEGDKTETTDEQDTKDE